MIEKIRKKFIAYTMLAVISVFSVIIVSINGLFLYRTVNELDSVTQIIADSGGILRKNKNFDHPTEENKGNDDPEFHKNNEPHPDGRMFKNKEMPYATRYFFAVYDTEQKLTEINLENIISVEQEDAEKITDALVKKGISAGWKNSRRYRVSKTETGYIVIVLDSENQVSSMLSVLIITLLVSFASTAVLYIIIRVSSKKVIRPIAESYEKQKQFITDAGHELKTPLTAISANMELVKMTSGENKWTDAVARQTDKMTKLINQLIRLSKMDEDSFGYEMNEFSLSEAAADTVDSFGGVTDSKGIKLITDIKSGISVINDEAAVRQIISVIMDNAVKYCDEHGEISVSLSQINQHVSKNKAILTIQNDFADTDRFDSEKVFDRFYRGDKAHVSDGSFGLGLSIARSAADSCGIKLSADKGNKKVIFSIVL